MADLVVTERLESVMVVTINRPQVLNALSREVVESLSQLCNGIAKEDSLRAVIFTGGDKAFSVGADLKERQGFSDAETLAFVSDIQGTFQKIAELPMPTIAAINGHAFGGGLELALACDLRVMNKDAQLGLLECGLGIIPGAGGTQRLPRLIGMARAMEMIFLAEKISGVAALAMGLVNYLEDSPQATLKRALQLGYKLANNAPLAIRAAKEALLLSQEKGLKDALVGELAAYHEILCSKDRKEGLKAFSEKRAPHFIGA